MDTWVKKQIKKESEKLNNAMKSLSSGSTTSTDENFKFPDDVTFITSSDYLQHQDKVPVFEDFIFVYNPDLDGWVKTPKAKPSTSHILYTEPETENNNIWLWLLGGVVVVGGGFLLFGGKKKKKRK